MLCQSGCRNSVDGPPDLQRGAVYLLLANGSLLGLGSTGAGSETAASVAAVDLAAGGTAGADPADRSVVLAPPPGLSERRTG
jgi:hypothetical protein